MPMKRLAGLAGLAAGLAVLLAVLCWPRPAEALNLCLLNCSCGVSANAVTFGSYDPLSGAPATAVGNAQVSCQLLVSGGGLAQIVLYNVGLTAGSSGNFTNRTLTRIGGAGTMAYNLYADAGMSVVWGDGTSGSLQQGGSLAVLLTGTAVANNYSIYGKIPAGQTVAGGNYTDTITVTMSF